MTDNFKASDKTTSQAAGTHASSLSDELFDIMREDYKKVKSAANDTIDEIGTSFRHVLSGHSTTREKVIVGGVVAVGVATGWGIVELVGSAGAVAASEAGAAALAGKLAPLAPEASAIGKISQSAGEALLKTHIKDLPANWIEEIGVTAKYVPSGPVEARLYAPTAMEKLGNLVQRLK